MRTLHFFTVAGFSLFLAAGCDTAPTPTALHGNDELTAQAARASEGSACRSVEGRLQEQGLPNDLSGTLTGDLEGTTAGELTDFVSTGNAGHNFGTRTFTVNGGEIPALQGSTFTVEFVGITLGPGPLYRANERAKAIEGLNGADFTAHGTLDATAFPFVKLDLEYRGVVCP